MSQTSDTENSFESSSNFCSSDLSFIPSSSNSSQHDDDSFKSDENVDEKLNLNELSNLNLKYKWIPNEKFEFDFKSMKEDDWKNVNESFDFDGIVIDILNPFSSKLPFVSNQIFELYYKLNSDLIFGSIENNLKLHFFDLNQFNSDEIKLILEVWFSFLKKLPELPMHFFPSECQKKSKFTLEKKDFENLLTIFYNEFQKNFNFSRFIGIQIVSYGMKLKNQECFLNYMRPFIDDFQTLSISFDYCLNLHSKRKFLFFNNQIPFPKFPICFNDQFNNIWSKKICDFEEDYIECNKIKGYNNSKSF
jgi:hypothetical protein